MENRKVRRKQLQSVTLCVRTDWENECEELATGENTHLFIWVFFRV